MILDTMGAWTRAPIPILRGHVFVWLHFFWWFSFFTHLLMVPVTMIGDGAVLEIPPQPNSPMEVLKCTNCSLITEEQQLKAAVRIANDQTQCTRCKGYGAWPVTNSNHEHPTPDHEWPLTSRADYGLELDDQKRENTGGNVFFLIFIVAQKRVVFNPPPHRQLTIAECGPKIGKESPVASWLLLLQLHRSSTFKQVFRSWVMTEKSGKLHDFFFPQHVTIDQKWAGAVGACPWPTTYSHLPSIHSSALWNMFALHRALWPVSTPMDRSFSHPSPWSWIKPHACLSPCCLCVCVCSARSRRAHRFIFENQHRNMISFLVTFNMGMRWSASAQLGTFSLYLHEDSMYLLI